MTPTPLHLQSDRVEFSLWIESCPCVAERDEDGKPVKAGPMDWLVVGAKVGIKYSDNCLLAIELKDSALELGEAHLLANWFACLGAGRPASEVFHVVDAPCDMIVFTEQTFMFAAWPLAGGRTRIQVNLFHSALRYLTVNPAALNLTSPPEIAPIGEWDPWAMALNLDLDPPQLLAAAAALRAQLSLIPQIYYPGTPSANAT